jgi:hypothetical protein
MTRFREPWPWEDGAPESFAPMADLHYYGVRIVPKTRCGIHWTPIIEVMESGVPTFWKCQKCPDRMSVPA